MAAANVFQPSGPPGQYGRGKHGQYVYWITRSHATEEGVQIGLRIPDSFAERKDFRALVVAAHA